MTDLEHNSQSPYPIIEIVEFLDDEDNLLNSLTRDLSLCHREIQQFIPEQTVNENHSQAENDQAKIQPVHQTTKESGSSVSPMKQSIEDISSHIQSGKHSTHKKTPKNKSRATCGLNQKKWVQFAEKIVAEKPKMELKNAEAAQPNNALKPLRFRQARMSKRALKSDDSIASRQSTANKQLSRAMSKTMDSSAGNAEKEIATQRTGKEPQVHLDEEFEKLLEEVKQEKLKQLRHRYRKMRYQNDSNARDKAVPRQRVSEREFRYLKEDLLVLAPAVEERPMINFENLDLSSIGGHDLETLVQAYDYGLFNDHPVENVIEKIEDFEKLNVLLESASIGVDDSYNENATNDWKIGEEKSQMQGNTKPANYNFDIMSENIVEHEVADEYVDEEEDFFKYDHVQRTVLERDVRQNYYRLKMHLFAKSYPAGDQDSS